MLLQTEKDTSRQALSLPGAILRRCFRSAAAAAVALAATAAMDTKVVGKQRGLRAVSRAMLGSYGTQTRLIGQVSPGLIE